MPARSALPLLFTVLFMVAAVQAHVPLAPGGNERLATAMRIDDPEKSYVVYAELHEQSGVQYYRFDFQQGERWTLSLLVSEPGGFVPDLVVMGPNVPAFGTTPPFLEIPANADVRRIQGIAPRVAEYEPFTPSAIYEVASYQQEIAVPGTYYAAVYAPASGGRYSLAAGYREEFTPSEWLLVPIAVVNTRLWEGQPAWLVFAPLFLTIVAAAAAIVAWGLRNPLPSSLFAIIGGAAGLLYLGTSGMQIMQTGFALARTGLSGGVALTAIFILIPLILGIAALAIAFRAERPVTTRRRIAIAFIGALGLVFWAGLVVGPILALAASVIPARHGS